MLLLGSSSPTFPRAGKCSPPREDADQLSMRQVMSIRRDRNLPGHAYGDAPITPLSLPLPSPFQYQCIKVAAGRRQRDFFGPRIRGPGNLTRERQHNFPGPIPEDWRTLPESVCIFAIKGCCFLIYFGLMFNYLALLN